MKFTETSIPGVYLVDMHSIEDRRGFFARAWSARDFEDMGLASYFPEINISSSVRKGTIRGLHYQREPYGEAKFVRCVRGSIFDIVIDLRPNSPTLHQWVGFELSCVSHQAIYLPAGCAHGIQTLEEDTVIIYMTSTCYHSGAEAGIRWNDPFFTIQWRDLGPQTVSLKDQSWPDFQAV